MRIEEKIMEILEAYRRAVVHITMAQGTNQDVQVSRNTIPKLLQLFEEEKREIGKQYLEAIKEAGFAGYESGKAEIFREIEGFKNEPSLYHHICYGTGRIGAGVVIVDHYGVAPKLVCSHAFEPDGELSDFCCGPGECPRKGKIKGFQELTPAQRTENFAIDKILQSLKSRKGE